MNAFKRSLSMLLCLVLMFSAVPWSALAVEVSPVRTITLPEATETAAVTEPVASETPVSTKSPTAQSEFVFVEPGKENDSPVGDVIITDQAYRVQMNPDMQSYTIVEYFGSEKNVVIPSTYNGLPITRIGSYAFLNRTAVQTVRIPESVTRMETDVFAGCKALQYNEYDGGKYLGSENNAYYYYCGPVDANKATITEATMHPDTKLIAAFAFRGCEKLRSVVVPDGVKQVGYGMVFGCELESITLPFVGELGTQKNPQFGWVFGARSFGGNISYVPMSLKTVVITGGADGKQGKIAQGAFYGVDMIESITLPFLGGSVDNTENAFISYYWGASSYEENILPTSVKSVTLLGGTAIADYAFYNCSIESMTVPVGITCVGDYAFSGCCGITNITIPEGVTAIGDYAFSGCSNINIITLPKSVTSIGNGAFSGCGNLTTITIPNGISSVCDFTFSDCSSIESIIIPKSVTSIGESAFSGCSSLTSLTIPDSVTYIDGKAFYKCCSIENITIPDSVKRIGYSAFEGCSGLTSITIPDGVTSLDWANAISASLFKNCSSLKSVIIPKNVTIIRDSAFSGCSSLECVTVLGDVTHISNYAFSNCSSLISITIPKSVNSIGKSAFENCSNLTSVTIPDGVTSIGDYTFSGCSSLSSFTIPEHVTSIGSYAFRDCSSLTNVTIPESVTAIGRSAFLSCSRLTSITIPNGLISIDALVFYDCSSLTSVTIPESVTTISDSAFSGCSSLTSITIPESITTIGNSAFRDCNSLINITIPNGVTTIGNSVFRDCNSLINITIPNSVTSIGSYGFYNCSSLESITLPNDLISIGNYAFSGCNRLYSVTNNSTLPIAVGSKSYGSVAYYAYRLVNPYSVTQYKNGYAETEDGFLYKEDNGFYSLEAYLGTADIVTLPTSINGRSYTIYGMRGVKNVIIPENVTSISDYAFYGCSSLTSITIPDSVTSIGACAFYGCSNLTSIRIPKNLKRISYCAFEDCNSLVDVYISEITTWCQIAFANESANPLCYAKNLYVNDTPVRAITVPESITEVNAYTFYAQHAIDKVVLTRYIQNLDKTCFSNNIVVTLDVGNPYLQIIDGIFYNKPATQILVVTGEAKNVHIPMGVTAIAYETFHNCSSLESVILPSSVTTIGDSAFRDCNSLISITIPNGVTTIDDYAFSGCSNLTSITIPESITTIGDSAFCDCNSLISITIPNGVTSIGNYAFSGCTNLTSLTVPESVTTIGYGAFYGCSSITSIMIPDGVTTVNGNMFSGCSNLTSIVIPESVKSIGQSAFEKCSSLTNIAIPNDVNVIANYTFSGCSSLTSLTIPDGVTSIGKYAFSGCTNLIKLTIPNGVTSISENMFSGCSSLTSLTIPDGVTSIGKYAFSDCTNLIRLTIPNGVTSISENTFSGCSSLTSLTIPDGVTSIGKYAFSDCTNLIKLTIPNGVTSISENTFSGCSSLTSITIPGSITTIGNSVFRDCNSLINITIPNSVTSIGSYAFYNCSSLTSIIIPEGITYIDYYTFSGCSNLISVSIPESVKTIRQFAFNKCSSLMNITIPGSMQTIELSAFDDCINLYYVINNSKLAISVGAFSNGGVGYYALKVKSQNGRVQYKHDYKETENGFLYTGKSGSYSLKAYIGAENTVTLPATINGENYTICEMRGVKNIIIPEEITFISDNAFSGCSSLESVDICGRVGVGANAFADCTELKIIDLNDASYLGDSAFSGCSNLNQIIYNGEENAWRHVIRASTWDAGMPEYTIQGIVPNSGTLYETNADCTEFYISGADGQHTDVKSPAVYSGRPVTAVLSNAFNGNQTVESITLPESVWFIGEKAFADCTALQEIVFPDGLQWMGHGVLNGCSALPSLDLPFLGSTATDSENAYLAYTFGGYDYQDNAAYVPDGLAMVTIRQGTKIIDHAFENCAKIQQINLPNSITEIGRYSFAGCAALEQISLSANLTEMGDYAFAGCASLTEIQLPTKLTEIGDCGFRGCASLKELVLPDSVHTVGVMLLDGCNSVTSITIGAGLGYDGIADTHNQANGNPFFGLDKSASRLSTYKVAAGNKDFVVTDNILYRKMDIDGKPVEVEVVDAPAKANLSSYQMPDSIVKIGAYAFAYNNTLRSIDLNYVRMVGNNAFYRAENMVYAQFGVPDMDITLPEGVNGICYNQFVGREAFAGCTALQRVNLDSPTLLGVEEEAFADCSSLATVNLGKNIQYIGIGAFGSSGSSAPALSAIHVDAANTHFESIEGVLYQKKADGTLTLLVYPPMSATCEVKDGKRVFYVPTENVTGVESYAFRMAQNLHEIHLNPQQEMYVGDYAFANTMLERVYVGDNVVSLGLKRGEGEYTVFADSNALVAVEVGENNPYYSSQNGVLFDKNATRLIKYPAAKAGNLYELPDTVRMIASMAFKNNDHLQNVRICSQVDTVGLEAFYSCSALGMIFFDGVYAPTSVLENAFTTYDSLNEESSANPRTILGYSDGYYLDGDNGEYGWSNYAGVYNIALCESLPESEGRTGSNFYAVVVVDSTGNRLNNVHVTLTDPNGVSETIATGSNNASNGVAMFYNLFGSAGMGFSLVYDGTYSLKVEDRFGEYFTYTNPSFYLDEDMRITYVTLTKLPSIYGTTCGETDINTESAEINKAEYGYTNVELIDESKGFVEGNYKTSKQSEYLDISVIAYCDTTSGWAFTDAQGNVLDSQTNGLYQNGIKICDVASVTVQDDSVVFHFRADVEKLSSEVQIEARLKAFNQDSASFVCSTILNIHVFDFLVTEDDVNLDTQELEVDLAAEDDMLATLFGSSTLDVKLGENLSFGIAVDGSRVEMTLGAEGSKSFGKSGVGSYPSYEKGYDANHEPHNKNTYFFQFKDTFKDEKGVVHNLTYNVRFARGTEKSNYFYYRCYVYEGKYENEVAKYFGAVNGLNDTMSKLVGAKTYRERVAPKALLIYKTCSLMVNKEAKTVKDIKKVAESAAYIEAIENTPRYSNNHTFDMELSGKMVFEYDKENGLKPVSSEIHGELYYTFKHNSQFVVWVIPVVLEVEVKVGGEVDIKLKFDEDRGVSLEEAKLTISAAISARVGVGCSVASVGIYGKVGMVLVLDFYPEFGVESFDLSGEIGAYVKVLWYTKDFQIAKFSKGKKMPTRAEMFLVKNYTSQDLDSCEGSARILSVGGQVYKIFYVNASGLEGYDAYNYRKLAIARWNGTDWDDAVILDPDCCRNDASYDLYFDGKQIYVVFAQQTELLDESSVNDTYQASSNMAIKVATILDLENITVTTVHSGENYKYLPTMTRIGDELAVVWAENADNNMFGVSPYNYIDANGESHVFETTANAVYISMFQADGWQTPIVVEDGLSAVTDIAAAEDGSICFIVDQNGDLGDSEDRLLYNSDLQTVNAVNSLKNGSVTGVDADGDDYIYYLQSNNETVLSGFRWLYADENIPQVADFGENYRILRDDAGNVTAVFYIGIKTWQEGETTVDGSAMYAVFCNDGVWGEPVEIGAFPAEKNVYISYFDVIYRSNSSVMIVADFVDKNGVLLHQLTESDVSLEADLSVEDYEIDYVNRILNITVINQGAKPAQVFTAVDDGSRVSYPDAIASGNRHTISVPLASCGSIEPDVFVYDSESADAICTIDDIDLNYADVVPMSKQLLLGEENNLLVGVKNTGVLANAGYLIIRPGNYDSETIGASDLVAAAQSSQTLPEGTVVAVNDKTYGQFWIVKITVEPGAVNHYEVNLSGFAKAEGLFSVYAYVDTELEKGSALENNMTYLAYQQLTGVLSEGEEVKISPKLQSDNVEFDIETMETVSVGFTCGADNSVVSVSGLQQTDYQVTCENGKGSLTILKNAFSTPGTYELEIGFADGESCKLSVLVPQYYDITWMVNGEALCVTKVKHGDMPYLASNPVNADYQFVGWSVNASGTPVGIQAATGDTTYYAVWGTKDQAYEITWVFTNEKGEQTTVTEQYAYNKIPEYLGKIPAPANKIFANWDKPISAVTENTTYTAVYKKAVVGSATISNTAFETAPGKNFITTLQILNVQDMEESTLKITYNTDVVTLVDCVCRDNVTLVEQGDDYLVFSLAFAQNTAELADLTFRTDSSLEPGETQFLEGSSEDLYLPVWNDILIRDQGDLPGSGMVDQWNVSLDDDLRVNFYVKLSESIENTAKIQITVGEETTIYRASELSKAVNGSYIASVRVSAAQMTDYIMVVVMDGGKILGMSTYTVRAYADAILAEESFRQYHALVKEMLNYGGQAQTYFDYGTEELANAGITGVAAQEIPETAEKVATKGTISGVRFYGASLVYRDKIALRYYFTINGSVADYTFTANGKTYTPVLKDGLYYVEIDGILPQNLDRQITLTVQNGEGKQLSVTYGPMNYIVRMNEKSDDSLKALLKALYNYHLAAKNIRVAT